MRSYTLEMADGSGISEGFFDCDRDAIRWAGLLLVQRNYDSMELVQSDWEGRTPDSMRMLFWANETKADGDEMGVDAIAHLVKQMQ